MKMCQLCQNYQKAKNPDTETPQNNPCFEKMPYRHEYRGILITCQHCSYITGGTVKMKPRKG